MGRRDTRRTRGFESGGEGGGTGAGHRAEPLALLAARRTPDVLDDALLHEVHAINATGVELLVQSAAQLAARAGQPGPAREPEFPLPPGPPAAAWVALDAAQRRRVAAQPFLLFSLGLEHGARWRGLVDEIAALHTPRRIAESRPRSVTVDYARLLLQYAWHLARTAPLTAGLVAGLSSGAVAVMRDCHVEHLDAMAERGAAWLRPRWANAPALWNDLLLAARPDAAGSLARTVALRAVQRAGAALAAPPGAPAAAPGATDRVAVGRSKAGDDKIPVSL